MLAKIAIACLSSGAYNDCDCGCMFIFLRVSSKQRFATVSLLCSFCNCSVVYLQCINQIRNNIWQYTIFGHSMLQLTVMQTFVTKIKAAICNRCVRPIGGALRRRICRQDRGGRRRLRGYFCRFVLRLCAVTTNDGGGNLGELAQDAPA